MLEEKAVMKDQWRKLNEEVVTRILEEQSIIVKLEVDVVRLVVREEEDTSILEEKALDKMLDE